MGSIFLVRHATTAASEAGVNLGQRTDAPLTADGELLAERSGRAIAAELTALPGERPRIISSPALRCRQTAGRIANQVGSTADGIEVEAGLWEIDYGEWEGLSAEQCAARDPELRSRWEANPFDTSTPSGESGADVAARSAAVLDPLERWVAAEPRRAAIVVTHNHVIRLRIAALLGLPMADYRRRVRADPGGYSLATFRPEGSVVRRLNALPRRT